MRLIFLVLFAVTTCHTSAQSTDPLSNTVLMLDGIGGEREIYLSKEILLELDSLYLLSGEHKVQSFEIDIIKHRSTLTHHLKVQGNKIDKLSKDAMRYLEVPFIVIIGGPVTMGDKEGQPLDLALKLNVVQ